MALDRIVSMGLRAAELVFAAIVAGVTGDYLHHAHGSSWNLGRFIYTEVVAGLSIFLALIWLIPFSSTFIHWPMDIFISILWWVVFGLLVDVSYIPPQLRIQMRPPYTVSLPSFELELTPFSSWLAAAAVPSSTGATFLPAATSAASSRPTSPLLSSLPSSGLFLLSSASSGFVSVSNVLPEPTLPTPTVAAGIAAATSKRSEAFQRAKLGLARNYGLTTNSMQP
jgi:hypothetical protein